MPSPFDPPPRPRPRPRPFHAVGGSSEHDWNREAAPPAAQVVDETLRDGLQGGVPRMPSVAERADLLVSAEALGIREAVIGFPADPASTRRALEVARGARRRGVTMRLGVLGRVREPDVDGIARVRDGSGQEVVAWLFVGTSRIRRAAERWSRAHVLEMVRRALGRARSLGLAVNFGLEDASRATPAELEELLAILDDAAVETATVCDTVGWLTPPGCRRLVAHVRAQLRATTGIDFHGHSDRGLVLANSLAAVSEGASRIHATALGIGERSGNAPLELVLANLALEGAWDGDLRALAAYCHDVARVCGLSIPERHPVFGARAFATEAGVHAAAMLRGQRRRTHGGSRVYSAIDPEHVGRQAEIRVGPASGRTNVRHVLRRAGIEVDDAEARRILERVRERSAPLEVDELCRVALQELRLHAAAARPTSILAADVTSGNEHGTR